jgi:hypothetical protein
MMIVTAMISFPWANAEAAVAPPGIQWQKSFGGTNDEGANSIQQTDDGGYIVAGYSDSNDGDVSGNHGTHDYWAIKLDADGDIQWQKSLGGSASELAQSIQQTGDGGYIVAGSTGSIDGDITGYHSDGDYWVVKLDAGGDMQWQKALGGSARDYAYSIQQTGDGGYIVAGSTGSNDGDVSGNHGYSDAWVVKLDAAGSLLWQKSLGGSGSEFAQSIQQTGDGGYIIAGESTFNDGDVSGNHGYSDYWIVKLDAGGGMQWQKSLGGSGNDYAQSIQQTGDGGYIVAGYSDSNDGDISGNHGVVDYWIVKLDEDGDIGWQKSLGGSYGDYANSIQQTGDGGYIVAGYSESNDGDVSRNHGDGDCWIVKLDAGGGTQWQKFLGGSDSVVANSIRQTDDGGYVVAGWSESNDGDVSGNHGNRDLWVVKLGPDGASGAVNSIDSIDITGFPLMLAPGKSFDVTLAYRTSGGGAPNPAPVLSATVDGAGAALVTVEVIDAHRAVITALPETSAILRGAPNSEIYGDAIINFTVTQMTGGSPRQKSAAVPLVIADDFHTSVTVTDSVKNEFNEANGALVSSGETILPGNAQPQMTALNPDWQIINSLGNVVIDILPWNADVLPECFDTTLRNAAYLDIDISGLVQYGKKGLLPLTFRVNVNRADLIGLFDGDYDLAGRILSSPGTHLGEIFEKIVIQKEIMEGRRAGWYTRLVDGILKPEEAVEKGILEVTGGESLTLSLSFYVLDDDILEAFVRGSYLIVPDGHYNEKIRDPIWVNKWRDGFVPGGNSEHYEPGGGVYGGSSKGGGGCASLGGAASLMAAVFLAFAILRRREGLRR